METIKITGSDRLYEIVSIQPVTSHVLRIVFAGTVPLVWGASLIYTADGTEADLLTGYDTVYRDEGQTVYLSNDGFVFLGKINEVLPWETALWKQILLVTALVTVLEFAAGCMVNLWLGWEVWDYSGLPGNVLGAVDWQMVASASLLAGILSLGTSVAGLPEVSE